MRDLMTHTGPQGPEASEDFVRDAARFVAGALSLEQVAALHGASQEAVLEALDSPQVLARVERTAAQMHVDGSALRLRARAVLAATITRLAALIDGGDASPTLLLRTAEVLSKLGAEPREDRPVRSGEGFSIHINLGDRSVSMTGAAQPGVGGGDVIDA
jgi:hypothetical protein